MTAGDNPTRGAGHGPSPGAVLLFSETALPPSQSAPATDLHRRDEVPSVPSHQAFWFSKASCTSYLGWVTPTRILSWQWNLHARLFQAGVSGRDICRRFSKRRVAGLTLSKKSCCLSPIFITRMVEQWEGSPDVSHAVLTSLAGLPRSMDWRSTLVEDDFALATWPPADVWGWYLQPGAGANLGVARHR